MRKPIAEISINAGNPGWYDPLTNIHLTLTKPRALVYEGSNTTNIKKAIRFKLLHVVNGDLNVSVPQEVREVLPVENIKTETIVHKKEAIKDEPIIVTESIEVVEEIKEDVEKAEPEKVVTAKKKSTAKKKTTTK